MEDEFLGDKNKAVVFTSSAFSSFLKWADGDFLGAIGLMNHLEMNLRTTIGRDIITAEERLNPKQRREE